MKKFHFKIITAITIVALLNFYFPANHVDAATLTSVSDTLSTLKASTAANHTIKFVTPTGITASQTITITLPTSPATWSFPAALVFGDIDIATSTSCTGTFTEHTVAASVSATAWGVGTSTQVLTLTSPTSTSAVGATQCVRIKIGNNAAGCSGSCNDITNPTANNNYVISIGGTMADSGSLAVSIPTNSPEVAVTASVQPTMSFALSTSTLDFGSLSSSAITYATAGASSGGTTTEPGATLPIRLTLSTNATSGLAITARDKGNGSGASGNGSAGLYSTANGGSLIAATSSSSVVAGTASYAFYAHNASSLNIASTFNGTTSTGVLSTTDQTFATSSTVVSGATVDIALRASISGSTIPGSYVDTLYIISTATF